MILAEVKGRKYKVGNKHGVFVLKRHCLEQCLVQFWSQDSFTFLKTTADLTEQLRLCDLEINAYIGI